ncbi:MAG: PAS domain-containing protein, partial [Acidimicrobiales bacterium]|nr:PAS domain-containing protein [Acidimicrobiales bacterium]
SDREKAIGDLEEALTLLSTLQAEAPVGFGFVDRSLRLVRLNHELAAILGAPIDELVGRDVVAVLPSALWAQMEPVYRRVLAGGEAVRGQRMIERRGSGGRTREITTSHYPVHVGGEIVGVGVVVQDVTERARSEGLRLAMMSQVTEGVCTLDRDGRLIYLNRAASKMLGWTESELRGRYMQDVVGLPESGFPLVRAEVVPSEDADVPPEQFGEGVFTRRDKSTFPALRVELGTVR